MTAGDQQALGVVDEVIPEPLDGAHTDIPETGRRLKAAIVRELERLAEVPVDELLDARYRRYRALGPYEEILTPVPPTTPVTPSRPSIVDRIRGLFEAGTRNLPAPLQVGTRNDPIEDSEDV